MPLLLINVLVTWRISSLLVNESGPGDILGLFRDRIGVEYDQASEPYGKNIVAGAFACTWCLSIWIGWGVALVMQESQWFAAGLAYSAGAIVIERIVRKS